MMKTISQFSWWMLILNKDKIFTVGSGILIIGVVWLLFWLTFAFPLFQEDPRWGHNFAIPVLFITVGLAYHFRKLSCQLIAVLSSFLTVPIFIALIYWNAATLISICLLIIVILLYIFESVQSAFLASVIKHLACFNELFPDLFCKRVHCLHVFK